ncbi:Serine carboxypeptidase-like 50 [Triticum urartu]|uniref:Serine carboxypeptidase-like 50 n=1 Tax=Triticum urartu TaxID=4572 RepID=M7Z022_TRIUA|nr:Serine carboxypeptidase-like 50 [Triticum urartu]
MLGVRPDVTWEECSDAVGAAMHEDIMKSVLPEVEALLRQTRVLLYQGIRDLRDGVVSQEAWMKELHWGGLHAFLDADRAVWRTGAGEKQEAAGLKVTEPCNVSGTIIGILQHQRDIIGIKNHQLVDNRGLQQGDADLAWPPEREVEMGVQRVGANLARPC